MGLEDDLSDDSGSILSIDNDLDFKTARKRANNRNQPKAKTKTVYLQLSGDKYRCNIRSDATWDQLKAAVETRLGLPPAVAQLASIRGARDGALIRTGNDIEDGEYLDLKLDLRELTQSKPMQQMRSPPRQQVAEPKKVYDDNIMPDLSRKSWVQSTNPKSISIRCNQQHKSKSDHKMSTNKNKNKILNSSCVSPWVQAASGTTILAPVITHKETSKHHHHRPSSAPTSRKQSQQQYNHQTYESGSPINDNRMHGASWSRGGLPYQDNHHHSKCLPNVMSTDDIDHIEGGGGGGSRGGTRHNINPSKSRVRPSSAPNVRSVIAGVQPVMPIAYGATEVMSGVFANPMDPRQRQQFLQMGEYENQREGRLAMAQKLMNADQPPNTPSKGTPKNKQQPQPHHDQNNNYHQQQRTNQQRTNHHSSKKYPSNKPAYGGVGGSVFFNKVNHRNHEKRQSGGHEEAQQRKQPSASKQPWLPTRNCNHRSAIISEEYPMLPHDGIGGPSATRADRY
jgi:hypothetical protein